MHYQSGYGDGDAAIVPLRHRSAGVSGTLSVTPEDDVNEHIRLLELGRRFLHAARDLASQGGQGWRFPVPHYLVAHAIELMLKAHLVHSGADEKALKKIGHDLEAALARTDASLRAILVPDQVSAIRWINRFYAGKELEYTAWGGTGRLVQVPDVSCLVSAAEALARHLGAIFRAELRGRTAL